MTNGEEDPENDGRLHIDRDVTGTGRRRRGRPRVADSKRLTPFSVRVSGDDVEALYTRWQRTPGAPRFSAWLRLRLLDGL